MTVSAPVRDLLQLALGSFPRSQEEKDRSRALLRCAYRGRTRKVRLSIVENCGGPGSGKPGPCPDPSSGGEPTADEWFKGSKVKTKSGKPLVVYHGATQQFEEFNGPSFFSDKPDVAESFAKSRAAHAGEDSPQPRLVKAHLNISKPFVIDAKGKAAGEIQFARGDMYGYRSALNSKNHDGIIIKNTSDEGNLFVVFSGKQVRTLASTTLNARPMKTDIRIKELAPYLHDMLGDVTKRDARAIARIVKRGVERRWKDSSVARAIVRSTKIEPDRAKVIARTEMSRARTDVGLGKKRDSDKVVFTIGNKDRACPICRKLAGKVYTVRKAAGVIPRHPNCFCFWSDAPKGARVSNSNPKGCNQYSGKDCANDRVSMADVAVRDKWVRSTAIRIGNPILGKSPEQLTDAQYNSLPIVYHGGDATSEHIFVTDSAKLAASHGDVKEFRLSPGATLYADPESQEELEAMPKHLRRGHVSLRLPGGGSAIVKRSELWPKNRNDSQVSNVFCATGEGGGVDPSCGANGPKQATTGTGATVDVGSKVSPKRQKQVLQDADAIKLDDQLVHAGNVKEDDLDEIENLMTPEELDKLNYEIDQEREAYVESQLDDIDVDIPLSDQREWARDNGWSDQNVSDYANKALEKLDDSEFTEDGPSREAMVEVIDEWYSESNSQGAEAIEELRDRLEESKAPQSLLDKLDKMKDDYDDSWSEAEVELSAQVRESYRNNIENDFDSDGTKANLLRQFYRNNEDDPRFSGDKTFDVWGKDPDGSGDNSLYFQTSKGAEYQVWDQSRRLNNSDLKWREIGFNDDSGSFSVTGAGNAVEVFSKASASVVSLLKNKDYPVASFTAAEESRQRLYDRMVKTISSVLPEYSAFAHVVSGAPKRYIVVKKNKVEEVRALFAGQGGTTEVLANEETKRKDGQRLVPIEPELRDEWFTEAGWTGTGDSSLQERTR